MANRGVVELSSVAVTPANFDVQSAACLAEARFCTAAIMTAVRAPGVNDTSPINSLDDDAP